MKFIHIDADIIVIDKPGGLLAVPGRGPDKQDCVVNRLRDYFPDLIMQPSVHRLDMDTSGVMILARNGFAHRNLSRQFELGRPEKNYIALLAGRIEAPSGRIELRFRLDVDNRPYQILDQNRGKLGITLWKRLADEDLGTRVAFTPLTGRTHQLRVHSAHPLGLNCPIVGDRLYGNGREGDRMMLHAQSLAVSHPTSGEQLLFTSKVPF